MGIRRGSISTPIIADGLVCNFDAANRASYIPYATSSYNTIDLTQSGSFINDVSYIPPPTSASCWSFDGVDDAILIPRSDSIEPNYITVGCWVKCGTQNQAYAYIISKGYDLSADSYALYFQASTSKIRFYARNSGGIVLSPQSSDINDNTWHYIVGTYDGSYSRLYVDGSEIGSGSPQTGDIVYNTLDLNLGKFAGDTSQPFGYEYNGNIANVQMYNRGLSSTDVLHNYNALKGRFS